MKVSTIKMLMSGIVLMMFVSNHAMMRTSKIVFGLGGIPKSLNSARLLSSKGWKAKKQEKMCKEIYNIVRKNYYKPKWAHNTHEELRQTLITLTNTCKKMNELLDELSKRNA